MRKSTYHLKKRDKNRDKVTSLLYLDASGIGSLTQKMYLLHKGFTTGKEVPLANVAKRFGLPETETAVILSSIEEKAATKPDNVWFTRQ